MKERPILFKAEMVRAILDGRKTMTRRLVNRDLANAFDPPRGPGDVAAGYPWFEDGLGDKHKAVDVCPFGKPGDRLWVRETWRLHDDEMTGVVTRRYRADDASLYLPSGVWIDPTWADGRWRPSIHMPRWVSRIDLEITGVRVERIQDITEEDARAEGCLSFPRKLDFAYSFRADDRHGHGSLRGAFRAYWDSLAAPGVRFEDNPWVWVVNFRRVPPWSRLKQVSGPKREAREVETR